MNKLYVEVITEEGTIKVYEQLSGLDIDVLDYINRDSKFNILAYFGKYPESPKEHFEVDITDKNMILVQERIIEEYKMIFDSMKIMIPDYKSKEWWVSNSAE